MNMRAVMAMKTWKNASNNNNCWAFFKIITMHCNWFSNIFTSEHAASKGSLIWRVCVCVCVWSWGVPQNLLVHYVRALLGNMAKQICLQTCISIISSHCLHTFMILCIFISSKVIGIKVRIKRLVSMCKKDYRVIQMLVYEAYTANMYTQYLAQFPYSRC